MLLFVGLGNPGAKHAGNRHNIGFMAVDAIAKRHGFPPWRRRFQGVVTEGLLGGETVQLLLPETFMNESGRSVAEALRQSKMLSTDVVVFLDWLQLSLAKVRVVEDGGLGGHNGLRSITALVGNEYRQVRIGIGRPELKEMVHGYVLDDFEKDELVQVNALTRNIADNAELLVRGENSLFESKARIAADSGGFKTPGK
jgi:PTH1 family peptidyl-tRNA hydrolase